MGLPGDERVFSTTQDSTLIPAVSSAHDMFARFSMKRLESVLGISKLLQRCIHIGLTQISDSGRFGISAVFHGT